MPPPAPMPGEVAEADQAANEQKLVDSGATIVRLSDEQLAANAAKVRANVWPTILEDVGADWGKTIVEQSAN